MNISSIMFNNMVTECFRSYEIISGLEEGNYLYLQDGSLEIGKTDPSLSGNISKSLGKTKITPFTASTTLQNPSKYLMFG